VNAKIHPAVFIKIKRPPLPPPAANFFFVEINPAERREFSFSGIEIDRSFLPAPPAMTKSTARSLLKIRGYKPPLPSQKIPSRGFPLKNVGKSAIAVVTQQSVYRHPGRTRRRSRRVVVAVLLDRW